MSPLANSKKAKQKVLYWTKLETNSLLVNWKSEVEEGMYTFYTYIYEVHVSVIMYIKNEPIYFNVKCINVTLLPAFRSRAKIFP
jgi:hypothetical protein